MVLMFIFLAAASAVGIWQNEKAKEKRRRIEKRKAKEFSQILEFGTFELNKGNISWDELDELLQLRDKVSLKVDDTLERIEVYAKDKLIGEVPAAFNRFKQLLEIMLDGRLIQGACMKKSLDKDSTQNQILITFEVK